MTEKNVLLIKTMEDERKLLEGAQRFDEHALAEIYDRLSPGIFRYAMRLLGDVELAEECVSETFSRFLTALDRGGGPQDKLTAYLYRTAHNWITDRFRRRDRNSLSLESIVLPDLEMEPSRTTAVEFERQRVREALAMLTPDQRQVIVLKYLEDWSNQEIAQALDKPIGAVKSLQHRGINALRRIFERQEKEQ